MKIKKITTIVSIGLAIITSMVLVPPAFAATTYINSGNSGRSNNTQNERRMGMMGRQNSIGMMNPGVSGKVTAINGSVLTVNGHQGFATTSTLINYSVNASGAVIKKDNATTTLSAIQIGDMVRVHGTVTGTNVVATQIFDGIGGRMMGNWGDDENGQNRGPGKMWNASSTQVIGNGEPVIAGTVSQVNGSTLTVTTASNITYTVDATNAKVLRGQNTVALSNVVVGDKVVVQGTVSGNSVAATTIIDHVATPSGVASKSQSKVFGGVGQFFMHLFGY